MYIITTTTLLGHRPPPQAARAVSTGTQPSLEREPIRTTIRYYITMECNVLCFVLSAVRATPINRTYSGSQRVAAPRCPGVIAADGQRHHSMDAATRHCARIYSIRLVPARVFLLVPCQSRARTLLLCCDSVTGVVRRNGLPSTALHSKLNPFSLYSTVEYTFGLGSKAFLCSGAAPTHLL